jgi:hypothetical protein
MAVSGLVRTPGGEVGRRTGEWNGLALHILPGLEGVMELVLLFNALDGTEHELGDVGEGVGSAPGYAILCEGGIEFAKDEVDVGGGHKATGNGGADFGTKLGGFLELALGAGVKDAERRVLGVAQ